MMLRTLAISVAVTVMLVSMAFSQDPVIRLDGGVGGDLTRPAVVFPHGRHEADIACGRCHHDFDKYGASLSEDPLACAECHGAVPAGGNPVALTTAFHRQCKGCHARLNRREKADLPVTCGRCHSRAAG